MLSFVVARKATEARQGVKQANVYAGEDVRRGIQTRVGAKTCERKEVEVYLFQLC